MPIIDIMSSVRSFSSMFIWNALAKADSSMLMALDMFAAIWFMDCCMAADTCVSSAVCICCMYAPSTFCMYELMAVVMDACSWLSSACAMAGTACCIFADSCCCSWVCRASAILSGSMDSVIALFIIS
ncbi:MAG: hypothetical protein MEEGG_02075 [Eggerthella lenta]